MRSIWLLVFVVLVLFTAECFAQVVPAVPSPSPIALVTVQPASAPSIAVSPKAVIPVVVDVVKALPVPVVPAAPMAINLGSGIQPVVVADVDQAPPQWMQSALVMIKSLPVVGPIISKAIQWLAVICSILTALSAFVLVVLKSLNGIASAAQLEPLADAVKKFQTGPIYYWLRYASMFNAQKPVVAAPVASAPEPQDPVAAA